MAQVLVRGLDDAVVARLKARAAANGRALEAELREIITTAAALTVEEKVALSRYLRSLSPPLPEGEEDSTSIIRRSRDSGFRE